MEKEVSLRHALDIRRLLLSSQENVRREYKGHKCRRHDPEGEHEVFVLQLNCTRCVTVEEIWQFQRM